MSSEYHKQWYKKNKEKVNKKALEWRKNNPEKFEEQSWRSHLNRTYGITPEKYNEMIYEQNGVCAICLNPETFIEPKGNNNKLKRLCVDHCHKTGKIRRLLCNRCNKCVGQLDDNPHLLRTMADYLEKYNG